MAAFTSDKSYAVGNSRNFSKTNNFIKIMFTNTIVDQVTTTSRGTTNFSYEISS